MACINLPAFPIQILLRRHPEWSDHPVSVVDSDKPLGKILWVNERARSFRILPGMHYAAGLSLAGNLRGAVVPEKEIEEAVATLGKRLRSFSPHIEPADNEPGIFWIDASGLKRLYGSLRQWAGLISSDMDQAGFCSTVVVGFNRFNTYAIAKSKQGIVVLKDPDEEVMAAQHVPLDRLSLESKTRDLLENLGINTVGQSIDLPTEGIAKRFGMEAYQLHQQASGNRHLPLQPEKPDPPPVKEMILEYAEFNMERLLVVIEGLLHPLLEMLADRAHAITEVQIRFRFARIGEHTEHIRPAEPTLDACQLLELIRLRLQTACKLPDGVVEVKVVGQSIPAKLKQNQLFRHRAGRDLVAANRALARVRAELGDKAVVQARLRDGHLPEGRFTWEPLDRLTAPKPRNLDLGRVVRRFHNKPIPLQCQSRYAPEGWLLSGLQHGPVERVIGPYIVSGGWWRRMVHREYYFAETQKGELYWVYWDRNRRRWFLQGRVE